LTAQGGYNLSLTAALSSEDDRVGFCSIIAQKKERLMFKGFRQFILRGNVIDLAVAVVMAQLSVLS